MSDRLKLSDAKGDAEAARIAVAQELTEDQKKIKELEKNIATLEAELAKQKRSAPSTAAPTKNKIGARKHASFMAISTAPSINKTPIGPSMVPVPYPTVQDLTNSISTAKTVNFNGSPAYLLDCSSQTSCKGDAPGTGKGVRSGTVSGEVKPVQGSKTVRIEGKRVVREGDACTMNGGNNPGIFVIRAASAVAPLASDNLSHQKLATNKPASSDVKKWIDKKLVEMSKAVATPIEGGKGAVKGTINTIPQTVEALLYGAAMQQTLELEEAANVHAVFKHTKLADSLRQISTTTRAAAEKIEIPKFEMSNQAQSGGESIASIAQMLAGLGGIARYAAAKAAIKKSSKQNKPSLDSAHPNAGSDNGVKIIGAKQAKTAKVVKNMTYDDLADWLRGKHGISDPDKLKDMINSFDLAKPVELVELPLNLEVVQYVREGGAVGTFFAYPGTSPGALAISGEGRVLTRFLVSEPVSVLRGTAAPFPTGKYPGVGGPGGGIQLISPRGSKSLSIILE
jgi:uncharacterized Zn-binding protein involved in type VI secretion